MSVIESPHFDQEATGAAPPRRADGANPSATLAPLLAAATVIAVRAWTSRKRRVYEIWPDEPAQLGIARFIGSGVRWTMHDHSTWRPGFGTLLAPVYWFAESPTTVFRTALILNAVLGGVAAVLLYALARRLTSLGPWAAAAVATIVGLAPAMVFTTNYAWSESLVQVLYLASVLLLLRFHVRPTVAGGIAGGTVAVAAFATHSRMLPLAVMIVALAAIAAWRRRITPTVAGVVVGWTALAFAAASWYSAWIVDQLWREPFARNSYGGVLAQLTKLGSTLTAAVGQTWYLLVTTAGLAGVGALTLGRRAWGRRDDDATATAVADARIVLATTAMSIGLSILFMADRWRADQIVYGRYNDVAVMPVLVLGLATILAARSARRRRLHIGLVIALMVGTGVLLEVLRGDELAVNKGPWMMILGLQPFVGLERSIDVLTITAVGVALALLIALWTARCRDVPVRAVVLVPVAALVFIGYTRSDDVVNRALNSRSGAQAVAEVRGAVVPAGAEVAYFLPAGSNATARLMEYQFYLPDVTFVVVDTTDPDAIAARFLFAPSDDPTLADGRATIRWLDPRVPVALWDVGG